MSEVMELIDVRRGWLPGSYDQPWSWADEHNDIITRECACCGRPGHYMQALADHVREKGEITEPVLLGSDGRVWDGHHRIVAASIIGLPVIPVERADKLGGAA